MVLTIPSYQVCVGKFPSLRSIFRTSWMEKAVALDMKKVRVISVNGQLV